MTHSVAGRPRVAPGGWIRRYHEPPAGDAPLVVCFPHAGGAATGYFVLSAALCAETGAEVLVVQYPGRQDRLAEPCLVDLREMADEVVAALRPRLRRPPVLFGHSMGSVLAYEVALRLERSPTGPAPLGLIASGRTAPSIRQDFGVHRMDDRALAGKLAELAGTASAVLTDPELLATVIPAVRADFTAVETYQDDPPQRLDCPISAYRGDTDEAVPHEASLAWGRHTSAGLSTAVFTGGHFYLQGREVEVSRAIGRDMATFGARTPAGHR